MRKFISVLCALVLALSLSPVTAVPVAAATIHTVGPGKMYTTIQAAVDNVTAGDTILVYPGEYEEVLLIETDNLTLISSGGADETLIWVSSEVVVEITADGVIFGGEDAGFTVGLEEQAWCGIYLDDADDCQILGDNVTQNTVGIYAQGTDYSLLIEGNRITDNSEGGIFCEVDESLDIDVFGNTINSNGCSYDSYGTGGDIRLHGTDNTVSVITANITGNIMVEPEPGYEGGRVRVGWAQGEPTTKESYVTLTDNDMDGGGSATLKLHASDYLEVTATGNNFLNNEWCGNQIGYESSSATMVTVLKATFVDNDFSVIPDPEWNYGILRMLAVESIDATVIDNTFTGSDGAGTLRIGWACGEVGETTANVTAVIGVNTFTNNYGGAILTHALDNLDVEIYGNSINGTVCGGERHAVEVVSDNNVTANITGNTITDFGNAGVYVEAPGTSAVNIDDNEITDGDEGIYLEAFDAATITGNTISNCDKGVEFVPDTHAEMENNTFADNTYNIYHAAEIVTGGSSFYGNIQDAIDNADPGETINVYAGEYDEILTIDKSLIVQSEEGAEETTIYGYVTIDLGLNDEEQPLAETVSFQGFTMNEAEELIWLEVDNGSSATISNNILEYCWVGIGLVADNVSSVTISQNIIQYYDYCGIMNGLFTVDNGSSVTIEENQIYGPQEGESCGIGFDAVVGGSELTIYHNMVIHNKYGIGIGYVGEESTVTIEENIVSENYEAIYVEEVDESTVTIIGSAVGAWEDEELGGNAYGIGFGSVYDSTIAIGGDSREEGNLISQNDSGGISFSYLEASNVDILNNAILDNAGGQSGIDFWSVDEDSTVDIHLNSIVGNSAYGVYNNTQYTVNATCNFWGGTAGPQHASNPYNTAAQAQGNDVVSNSVDYIPWMILRTLVKDWNIWSRPIAPDEDSWAQMQAELVEDGIKAIYYYDTSTLQWGADPDEANLLDAFYIKMPAESRIRYCFSAEATWPGQKDMTVGWNFVGLAQPYPMVLTNALSDAEWGTGQTELLGYNRVISPSLNGEFWQYLRGDEPPQMFPTEGYWVLMVNDGILGGFTTTPIVP